MKKIRPLRCFTKRPLMRHFSGGRYWTRTSDFLLVRYSWVFRIKKQGFATNCKSTACKFRISATSRTKRLKLQWLGPQFRPQSIQSFSSSVMGAPNGPQLSAKSIHKSDPSALAYRCTIRISEKLFKIISATKLLWHLSGIASEQRKQTRFRSNSDGSKVSIALRLSMSN